MTHQDTPTAQAALAQLIERHSAAYNALSKAIDDHEDDPHHPAVDAAIDADEDALLELCSISLRVDRGSWCEGCLSPIFIDATSKVEGPSWPNGCHICEVEIDPETGVVEIVSYVSANDVGCVVNPMIVRGQLDGGVVQGIGQALGEQVIYDYSSGQLITASLMDYATPRADIIGDFVHGLDQSTPCRNNPLGVKGVGELGTIGATPTVVNAVVDALFRRPARPGSCRAASPRCRAPPKPSSAASCFTTIPPRRRGSETSSNGAAIFLLEQRPQKSHFLLVAMPETKSCNASSLKHLAQTNSKLTLPKGMRSDYKQRGHPTIKR